MSSNKEIININYIQKILPHRYPFLLIDKIIMAKNIHKVNDFVVCGGVSANSFLRKKLKEIEKINRIKTYVPKINYSTDNAAMIGINGYFKFKDSKFGEFSDYSLSKYKV